MSPNRRSRSWIESTKITTTSAGANRSWCETRTVSATWSERSKPAGALSRTTECPCLIPSFFGNGVPGVPAMEDGYCPAPEPRQSSAPESAQAAEFERDSGSVFTRRKRGPQRSRPYCTRANAGKAHRISMPTGLLLINLGTPDEPTTPAVRRYLREFLSDPRVIDINPVGRTLLLELVILPSRPAKSARAYQSIWDPTRGSPLLYHSRDLATGVAAALGPDWVVELAMRYGNPSIPAGLAALRAAAVDRIVVLPLFPQYASSSTGTAVARVMELAGREVNVPAIDVVPAFYADPAFLDAFATVAREHVAGADHVLFSFHGLPEHHMIASDPSKQHCLKSDTCCAAITAVNRDCYRAQCYATAREI